MFLRVARATAFWAVLFGFVSLTRADAGLDAEIAAALERAGDNRPEIEKAMREVPPDQQPGMRFLVANMPDADLRGLTSQFLLTNVEYAYRARNESAWKDRIPEEVFLNDVLPYASINERRDDWRKDFFERFRPLVEKVDSPGLAAARLNQQVFGIVNVKYSTQRRKADQSPYESMETGLASCTGLSVILVDACRAVGIPARIVGTPRWTDNSGNHTWVEVWDNGWHFTGACEASGDKLNSAWFTDRASQAIKDDPRHAIFATSFQRTGEDFPLIWNRRAEAVPGINVTDTYTKKPTALAEGRVRLYFRALDKESDLRVAAKITVTAADGKALLEGETKGESADANDHLALEVAQDAVLDVTAQLGCAKVQEKVTAEKNDHLVTFYFQDATPAVDSTASHVAIENLITYLALDRASRPKLSEQGFYNTPLDEIDAQAAADELAVDHREWIRASRAEEMEKRVIQDGELKMPFFYEVFGKLPDEGRSLYISMHGGGNAPPRVNDQQWENQKRLYEPEEGVYLAPRAPTNTWNLWHEGHIDRMFDRLIEDLIVFEDVNPDRVYIMGYSAGGDGVFQLAPRMADRLAAAAMMAGHPNETVPLGLRNLPFTLHMGGDDAAYDRNKLAAEWEKKLDELHMADPAGYEHLVQIHAGKGHWMDREDAVAVPWMAKYTRNPFPKRIVWKQDDVTHDRFYWLSVGPAGQKAGAEIVATLDGQKVHVDSKDLPAITVRLNDAMLDLDRPVELSLNDEKQAPVVVHRTIATLAKTLEERGDPKSMYAAEIEIRRAAE